MKTKVYITIESEVIIDADSREELEHKTDKETEKLLKIVPNSRKVSREKQVGMYTYEF